MGLQEGVAAVVDAAEGIGSAIPAGQVLKMLEGCAASGEIGAAVFCFEHLENIYGGEDALSKLPGDAVDRAFAAFKPLLRPSLAQPRIQGPWSLPPPGRHGVPNPRKKMGPLLTRLANVRKERQLAEKGEEGKREREQADAGQNALTRICKSLIPVLVADAEALTCKRRGAFGAVVVRLCKAQGVIV